MKLLPKKLLPFFILLFVVIGCTKLGRQAPGKLEQQREVIKMLNAKFSLRDKATIDETLRGIEYDCKFKFESGLEDDKITLVVYFCESTSRFTKEGKLRDVLTPGNAALIKNAGFEQVKLYERITDKLIDRATIQ